MTDILLDSTGLICTQMEESEAFFAGDKSIAVGILI
jgi:hypothetical protein